MSIFTETLQFINWSDALTDIFSSLVVTGVSALVGFMFLKGYMSQLRFSNKMKSFGFLNTSTNKQSKKENTRKARVAAEPLGDLSLFFS